MYAGSLKYCLALSVVTLAVYSSAIGGVFQFDDFLVIVENHNVHSWGAWWDDATFGIRPLLKASYTLSWTLGSGSFGFHLFNVVVHVANAVLLYFVGLVVLSSGSGLELEQRRRMCFVAVLIFAVHPVLTESVTYISGRSASLMAFFYLASFMAYVHGRVYDVRSSIIVLSPLCFILSLAVKETAITLPLALLLWELVLRPDGAVAWGRVLRVQAVHWLLLILVGVYLAAGERYQSFFQVSLGIRSIAENLLTQLHGIAYLFSRLVFVHRLNIDPDLPVFVEWHWVQTVALLLLVSVLSVAVLNLRKSPWVSFGILWFFLHLAPTNSLIPRFDVANERALYLAAWGVVFPLVIASLSWIDRRSLHPVLSGGVFLVVFVALIGFTVQRNLVYRCEIRLWEDTISKSPLKPRPHHNLGYSYSKVGRYEEAAAAYLKALQLDPHYAPARRNLENPRYREFVEHAWSGNGVCNNEIDRAADPP